jgi:O-phosphoseryl-tRNA(Cys) synthetase
MDDKDTANKICNEMEEHCDNKEKLKVDEQIELQKKCTEQDSPCSSTTYEHNEEARNFQKKTATHEKQKGVSMVRCI